MTNRLWLVGAILILLSLIMTLHSSPPIFFGQTVSVPVDELLRLNPE